MRTQIVLSACTTVALLACTSEDGPTGPEMNRAMAPADPTVAAAVDIWRERGPHPFGPLIGVSVGVLTNPAGQSVAYAFGGCDLVDSDFGFCTVEQISIYNVATDTWTRDRSFLVSVHSSNGVGAIGGKLYSSGGYNLHQAIDGLSSRTWVYDPAQTFPPESEARRVTELADMPKRTAEGVTGVISGKLYVLPGLVDENLEQRPFRRLYRYDPATNKWGARRSAPHFHRLAASGVIGGKFYVAGGLNSTDLDVYDPATDSWTTRAPIPKAGRAIGTALGGKLYVVVRSLNDNGTSLENHAYVYNPGTNKWSALAAPAWGHDGVVRVVINGKPKLLAVGGFRSVDDESNNSEVYTP
jgi:N-acetylneuraminic acid mutarotase